MEGQLLQVEREFLHEAVLRARPRLVLEVGTWKGGGSTYYIASALGKLRLDGHECQFHTCETDPDRHREASSIYAGPPWNAFVHCHNVPSSDLIASLISQGAIPDWVFFDGPENEDVNHNDFLTLDKHMRSGSHFSAHDWETGPRIDGLTSKKAIKLRPHLEARSDWEILATLAAPISVGLVLARKK